MKISKTYKLVKSSSQISLDNIKENIRRINASLKNKCNSPFELKELEKAKAMYLGHIEIFKKAMKMVHYAVVNPNDTSDDILRENFPEEYLTE